MINNGEVSGVVESTEQPIQGDINSTRSLSGEVQQSSGVGGVKDVQVNDVSVVDENKVAKIDLTPYAEKEDVYDKQTIDTALEGKADTGDIPTALSQLDNDANYVQDADYVHTDNNFTNEDKTAIGNIPENITDLSDIAVNNIQNGQVLKWDATQNKFVNANESGGGGGDVADVKVNGQSVVDPVTKEANIDLTGYAETSDIPTDLADLSDDATHRLVTDTEKSTWDNKADVSDIPTVNNPTITIQKNGQNVDTFTLNQTTNKVIDISVPTKTSDLQNDSSFITNTVNNLANYYLKSQTYTQAEVDALIDAAVNGRFRKVTVLPATGEPNIIYLVPKATPETSNACDEYIWQDNDWELIGSTDIDLSGYVTDEDLTTALADYLTTSAFNTAIANYYTKTEIGTLLDGKVDKETGKGLSTNDYDNTAKGIVDSVTTNLATKADKVSGATNGNLAGLNSSGNLTDSGVAANNIVKKSGDTMTGNLAIVSPQNTIKYLSLQSDTKENVGRATTFIQKNASASVDNGTYLVDLGWGESTKRTSLAIRDAAGLTDKLNLKVKDSNGTETNYKVFGEHNSNAYDNTDKAKVGKIDETTTSISGNPISISGLKANQLAINPIITLEPIQAGSGTPSPSNIRAISGYDKIEVLSCGKNLACKFINQPGYNMTITQSGDRTTFTTNDRGGAFITNRLVAGKTYVLKYTVISGAFSNVRLYSDFSTTTNLGEITVNQPFTPSADGYVRFWIPSTSPTVIVSELQLEEAESATIYKPPAKTDIAESLGQTVYGGSLDVRTGVLTVDRQIVTFDGSSDEAWESYNSYPNSARVPRPSGGKVTSPLEISNMYAVQSIANNDMSCNLSTSWIYVRDSSNLTSVENYKTYLANNPLQIVYELATPLEIQLTPHELSLLKDYAYVSTNGTNISLDYHNGEIASLSDVAQLSETVERLTEYIKGLINNA